MITKTPCGTSQQFADEIGPVLFDKELRATKRSRSHQEVLSSDFEAQGASRSRWETEEGDLHAGSRSRSGIECQALSPGEAVLAPWGIRWGKRHFEDDRPFLSRLHTKKGQGKIGSHQDLLMLSRRPSQGTEKRLLWFVLFPNSSECCFTGELLWYCLLKEETMVFASSCG